MEKLFDPYRRKYVTATPEEKVRQWFCAYLTGEKQYPTVAIANECTLNINGLQQRCDTIVYKKGEPRILIEYKAPTVNITQEVVNQALRYNTRLHVPYIILCNGNQIICCKINYIDLSYEYLPEIPDWDIL